MFKNKRHPSARDFVKGGEVTGREVSRRSSTTTYRRANPDNPKMAEFIPNFVYDFSEQMPVVPNGITTGLSSAKVKGERCMNSSKGPAHALSVAVGSGTDDKGVF
jgi:hypothetical protein